LPATAVSVRLIDRGCPCSVPAVGTTSEVESDPAVTESSFVAPVDNRRRSTWVVAWLIALLMCAASVVLYQMKYPNISPIDEFAHIDYAAKLSEGSLVGRGDRFGTIVMREFACRRLDASEISFEVPACNAPEASLRPEVYPENGYNVAFIHPPTYYVVAALGGSVAQRFDRSFVAGARLANLAWIVAFVTMMAIACRWLRASPTVFVASCVVCVANPASLHALGTVNPDAAGLFAGVSALVGYLGWKRSNRLWWLLLAVVPVAIKSTHGLATGVVLLLLAADLFEGWSRQRTSAGGAPTPGDTMWRPVSIVAGGSAVVALAVLAVQRAQASAPVSVIDQFRRFHVDSLPLDSLLANVAAIPPLVGYTPVGLKNSWVSLAVVVLSLALGAAALAAIGLPGRQVEHEFLRRLGLSTLVTMLLAGPALIVMNFVLSEIYVAVPLRYLISLLPLIAIVTIAVFDRSRPIRWAWSGLVTSGWLIMVITIGSAVTLSVTTPP